MAERVALSDDSFERQDGLYTLLYDKKVYN